MARCSPSGAHSSHGASRTAARGKREREAESGERGRPGTKSGPKEGGGRATARRRPEPRDPAKGTWTRSPGADQRAHATQAGTQSRSRGGKQRPPRGSPGRTRGPHPGPGPQHPRGPMTSRQGDVPLGAPPHPGRCGPEEADRPRAPAGDAAQEVPRPEHQATQCRWPQKGPSRDAKQPTQQQPLPGCVRQR